jgi:hypothetical protein
LFKSFFFFIGNCFNTCNINKFNFFSIS